MSSPFAYIAILPVRFYQRFISPMFAPRCRYYPTCSSYASGRLGRIRRPLGTARHGHE